MTILRTRQFEGDSPLDVQFDNPLPVSVLADVQTQAIRINTSIPAQVVVSTSVPTLIAPANPNRRSLLLTNLTGTQICHLLNANTVAAGTSRAILTGVAGSNMTVYAKDAVWGLSAVAAQTVLVWEEESPN